MPVRVPAQAVSDSPLDEKFIPMRPAENTNGSEAPKEEAKKVAAKADEEPSRPAMNHTASAAAVVNGNTGASALSNGSPIVPNVHAEAEEYYGGKEVVNRSRTYSIVSIHRTCSCLPKLPQLTSLIAYRLVSRLIRSVDLG